MTPDQPKDVPTRPNTPPEPVENLIAALIGLGIDVSPLYNGQLARAAARSAAMGIRRGSIAPPAIDVAYSSDDNIDDAQTTGSGNVSDNEGEPASPGWEQLDGSDPQAQVPAPALEAAPVVTPAAPGIARATIPGFSHAAVPGVAHAAMPGFIRGAIPGVVAAAVPGVVAAAAAPGVAPAATPGVTVAATPVAGIQCPNCQAQQAVPRATPGETVYVVTVGLQVGIFTDWHIVQGLVSGVSGACYRKYPNRAAAQAAFTEALNAGVVMVMTSPPVAVPRGPFH